MVLIVAVLIHQVITVVPQKDTASIAAALIHMVQKQMEQMLMVSSLMVLREMAGVQTHIILLVNMVVDKIAYLVVI